MERAEMGIYRILLRVSLRALHGLRVDCLPERLQIKNNMQSNAAKFSVYKIHTRDLIQTNIELLSERIPSTKYRHKEGWKAEAEKNAKLKVSLSRSFYGSVLQNRKKSGYSHELH